MVAAAQGSEHHVFLNGVGGRRAGVGERASVPGASREEDSCAPPDCLWEMKRSLALIIPLFIQAQGGSLPGNTEQTTCTVRGKKKRERKKRKEEERRREGKEKDGRERGRRGGEREVSAYLKKLSKKRHLPAPEEEELEALIWAALSTKPGDLHLFPHRAQADACASVAGEEASTRQENQRLRLRLFPKK